MKAQHAFSMPAKCKCQHCDQSFEFMSDRAGESVTCPSCGMDTILYVPTKPAIAEDPKPETKEMRNLASVFFTIVMVTIAAEVGAACDPSLADGATWWEMLLVFAFGGVIYFAPAIVARSKHNFTAIFVLNFLAGWTFIGWVGSLVWACVKDKSAE